MSIRLPRLLDDARRERARLLPVQLSLFQRLTELSTARMILPPDAPQLHPRDLMELYDEKGSVGCYRVARVQEDLGHRQQVHLEHCLCTLRDSMVPIFAFTGTVQDALTQLLTFQEQPLWSLGQVDFPQDNTIILATEYTDLFSAVMTLLRLLPDGYAFDFDQSADPWLLHLRRLPDTDPCEGRLSRNLHSIRVDRDASRLCTRVYPFGAEVEGERLTLVPLEGSDHLDAPSPLGVISRTFTSDLIFDVPTLKSVAELYLARHAQPRVTLSVSAVDLSSITGETLDAFRLGRMCRLALPDLAQTISQRIIAIEKPDVFGCPGQVTLTLSDGVIPRDEEAEIEELVRKTTIGKLLGGAVTEVVSENFAYGSFTSPIVHYFSIDDYAAVLDVRIRFVPDGNAPLRDLRIDAVHPPDAQWQGGSISAMPYLRRNELGQIAPGQHLVQFSPSGSTADELCGVRSFVTLSVIEKNT